MCLVKLKGPAKTGCFKNTNPSKKTEFAVFYDRGDFPIMVEHDTKGNKIAWKVQIIHKVPGSNPSEVSIFCLFFRLR